MDKCRNPVSTRNVYTMGDDCTTLVVQLELQAGLLRSAVIQLYPRSYISPCMHTDSVVSVQLYCVQLLPAGTAVCTVYSTYSCLYTRCTMVGGFDCLALGRFIMTTVTLVSTVQLKLYGSTEYE